MFTGTALRRATLRTARRQTPAGVRAHGHGHSHGDEEDVEIDHHEWPPNSGSAWKDRKPLEKKEPGTRLAEVLDVIRNAKYESLSKNQDHGDDLSMRLAAAEQENEKLTEELQKLEDQNERAAQELLKDAEELTFMSIRMEELEREAEALKELNVKLVQAADQLAAMVGNDEMAASTATHVDHDLAALRMEADSAKNALATAEARAAAERSDLIARIRTLEIDLAEAESEAEEAAEVGAMVIGGAATAGAELEAARVTIEKLSALAKRRGDELMAAEAAAAAAAREVASLKEQLANSSAGAGTGHLARVRELEVLMSEMLTAEEANVLEARIRELEIVMADMLEPEELDAALAKIRSLEIVMADMVDAEELEAAEARATQMEARAAALEVEADLLRARVRALEAEMAGMSYDEGENLTVAPAVPRKGGAFKRRAGQFTLRKFDFAAVKAKTTPAKAFKRSGTFSLRKMKFAPKASATSAAPTKRDERSVEEPVVFNFEQKKGGFKRTPGTFTKRKLSFEGAKVAASGRTTSTTSTFKRSGAFTLRKFDFAAVRAKTAPAKAFKRSGVFSLRKMKFTVRPAKPAGDAGFTRKSGQFTLRKFDFVAAKAKAQEGQSFKRGGNFTLRKMNFRENAQQEIALETRSGTFVRSGGNFTMRRFDFLKAR